MMKIEIHLFASLAKYLPENAKNKTCIIEISDHSVISDLIKKMTIPDHAIKLIFLNGIHASRTSVLKNGDRVGIFPPVGGG
jgi:molybdopterin synthase sulfur carrier subunit